MICSVDGCDRDVTTRGHCNIHYQRKLRSGEIKKTGTPRGEPLRWLYDVAIPYQGDECLIWPYGKTTHGYGHVSKDGEMRYVHILVCIASHGPPPEPNMDVAHNCGLPSCCNGKHLRWATRKENLSDMEKHGTLRRGAGHPSSIFSEPDIKKIRHLLSKGHTHKAISKMYGVARGTITDIANRKNWGWLE